MNNMLGAAIEAIEKYCKIRAIKSPKDKCALIGFSDKAEIIVEDFNIEQNNLIVNKCLEKLKPNGNTYFYNAFETANKIIQKINRVETAPIIILFAVSKAL